MSINLIFREHVQNAKEMVKKYIPRPKYSLLLDQAVKGQPESNKGRYIIMTGEAGCGKSSLLADWWKGFKQYSKTPTFLFFIGMPSFVE